MADHGDPNNRFLKMNDKTIIRVAILPVAEPVGSTWDEFRTALKDAWRDVTALSNSAADVLYAHDYRRIPDMAKLPKMEPVNLYRELFTLRGFWGVDAWQGCKSAANCVLRRVDKAYRASRYDVIWLGRSSTRNYRYPQPYPVHNAEWQAELIEWKPHVRFNLKGRRWLIRLKGGAEFARHLAIFRKIVNGSKKCELTIYRQGSQGHVMVKMPCHVEAPPAKSGHTMLVRTDPNAFLVAEVEGRSPWILNADHIRRWQAAHKVYLQRISEDTKREKRLLAQMARNIQKSRKLRCEKHNNRIDSWTHEATAMLVNYALRNGVAEIIYDDSNRDYLLAFAWHQLKTKLAYKCTASGVAFTLGAKEEVDV